MSSSSGSAAGSGAGTPLLLALAVGLVLADSSVVTLALPDILREFDSVVNDVAWVLISFNLALALVALPAARLARGRARRAFVVSIVLFALASLACAAAPSLGVLVAARAAQGLVGAVAVAAALELLVVSTGRDRAVGLWAAAGVLGAAVGPALGGFLTEGLSWQAMFFLQAPVALLTLLGMRGVVREDVPVGEVFSGGRPAVAPLIALGLAAAALSAALFLLVILLIEGWRHSPAEAALTVTVMPLAALVAGRWAGGRGALVPAIAGALLVAGGLAALGLLPSAHAAWTFVPQLAIGAGLGLALATLISASVGDAGAAGGASAPDLVSGPAAWTVAGRHMGIVVGLLLLTPLFTADLETVRAPAERAGLARVLDAPLRLPAKIALARRLDTQIEAAAAQELPDLDKGFSGLDVKASERPAIAALRAGLDEELDRGATEAFSRAFQAAALLALLAAAATAFAAYGARGASRAAGSAQSNGAEPGSRVRLAVAVPAAAAAAALVVAGYVVLGGGDYGPTPVANPCDARARPKVERAQRIALALLDGASCKLGESREDVLRSLLDGELPPGVDNEGLEDALAAGVDRAEEEDQLSSLAATGLRLTLRTAGTLGIIGLLLGER